MAEQVIGSMQRPQRAQAGRAAGLIGIVRRLSPAHQFMLSSLIVLLAGMFSSGWWLGGQVEAGVMHRTTATSALYIESFVAPLIQNLGTQDAMAPSQVMQLDQILHDTPLGKEIVAFIVWGRDGQILYSSNPTQIGRVYPITEDMLGSWNGEVTWELNRQNDQPHIPPQNRSELLLATYAPVRLLGTDHVIAVAEFYQIGDPLFQEIQSLQWQTCLISAFVTLVMYLLLSGFIRGISNTVVRQQSELSAQVTRLTDLLGQNAELHERMRRATSRTTTLNERFLHRISADLHDGAAQYLGLSLLHIDRVLAYFETKPEQREMNEHIEIVQSSVAQAMQEVRAVSSGLGLPQLDTLTLSDIAVRVVRAHEHRTGTQVQLTIDTLPESANLPVKITLYRILQEGLSNAYRHAGGVGQRIHVGICTDLLWVEVADRGPGFQPSALSGWDEHMGIIGMRERVESLGGRFSITSQPGQETCIRAHLPLNEANDD